MNFRKRSKAELPQFQITPMIDVVFLLLCFFITTAVFSQWEYEVDLTLPTAKTGKMPDRLPGEIIINIAQSGRITVNQQELDMPTLQDRLTRLARYYPGQPVILRSDAQTPVSHLVRVIDACRQADIWNFSIATRDPAADAGSVRP